MNTNYETWIRFYMEFADKLRHTDRTKLIARIKKVFSSIGMRLPTLERGGNVIDIDPFTIFGLFNKGITNTNRINLIAGFAQEFGVTAEVPQAFEGIPVLNNLSATFYGQGSNRAEHDIDHLWDCFHAALDYADEPSESHRQLFITAYDIAFVQYGICWNLTMGLYWIRPHFYLNLDSRNRWFILNPDNMPADFVASLDKLAVPPSGEKYLDIISRCRDILDTGKYPYRTFPELSYQAWKISEEVNEQNRIAEIVQPDERPQSGKNIADAIGDTNDQTINYWMYMAGDSSAMWETFYSDGVMGLDDHCHIGNLLQYNSKEAIKQKMKEEFDPSFSYLHTGHAAWQFARELKKGDVVFVKRGRNTIIGRGIVESEYIYDEDYSSTYPNIRRISWTHKGEWPNPSHVSQKTLTNITAYTDDVEKLIALFSNDSGIEVEENLVQYESFPPEKFLQEVYMSKEEYDTLVDLTLSKKNIILQGAPGVGKTYAAKRLAYSIMGVKDPGRVMMIQFHQSYSYEDFIEGYRPCSSGFELKKGAFYQFCKKAEIDSENKYFFIIDEINRGNLSKIFGELFMLIESDKRKIQLQLLYSGEKFAVPENVYIIGMMNTADRSLAMLDYALRRRFAFYEMRPGFDTDGFRRYQALLGNENFDRLIVQVESLNAAIASDPSLGDGFCIGHSYFCHLATEKVTDRALSAIVEYELIPLLKEYWFDEPAQVKDWANRLRSAVK